MENIKKETSGCDIYSGYISILFMIVNSGDHWRIFHKSLQSHRHVGYVNPSFAVECTRGAKRSCRKMSEKSVSSMMVPISQNWQYKADTSSIQRYQHADENGAHKALAPYIEHSSHCEHDVGKLLWWTLELLLLE